VDISNAAGDAKRRDDIRLPLRCADGVITANVQT
jgi:hypothetical protein